MQNAAQKTRHSIFATSGLVLLALAGIVPWVCIQVGSYGSNLDLASTTIVGLCISFGLLLLAAVLILTPPSARTWGKADGSSSAWHWCC